jgi:ribonuclease-3
VLTIIGRIFSFSFNRKKEFIKNLIPILGFVPVHARLYEIAFIHRSASLILPNGEVVNNERLEYLGDAILDAIVADYLFKKFPDKDEGFLTKMRSKMVKRKNLNILAYHIGISKLIISQSNTSNNSRHLYGNAFEALIGAIYLDKGFKFTSRFIDKMINRYVDIDKLKESDSDYKSRLIEWAQKNREEILFDSKEEQTANHIPMFISHVHVTNKELGKGVGKSKKEAEQKASRVALEYLNLD